MTKIYFFVNGDLHHLLFACHPFKTLSMYQPKDHYYHKAKEKGLPSRASFKIEELLKKFPLVRKGDAVLDLGAAPGGWTVMLARAVGPQGKVLALDLQSLGKVQGANIYFFQGDIFSEAAQQWIEEQLTEQKISCVCSDMSHKLTGIDFKDAYLSYELAQASLKLARKHLKSGGHLVTKIFPGAEFQDYLKTLRQHFTKVKTFKPQSTRKTSKEVYLVGLDLRPESNTK